VKGVFGSPGAGLENYAKTLQPLLFPRLLTNTFALSILSILFTCMIAIFLIWCISSMPNRIIKTVAIILISIPAFVPIASYAGVFFRILSPQTGIINSIFGSSGTGPILFLADKSFYSLIFAVMDALRNIFIPVIIGVLACEKEGARFGKIALVILIYALVRVTLFMSPDLETLLTVSNPLVYESSDVFDTFSFRTGMMQMQLSEAGALWILKTVVQLLLNIAVFFIIDGLIPRLRGISDTLSSRMNKGAGSILSIFGYVLFAFGSAGVTAAVFFPLTRRLSGNPGTFDGIRILLSNKMFLNSFYNLQY
jgi:ABC-type polysaccharide transport system permease subunit